MLARGGVKKFKSIAKEDCTRTSTVIKTQQVECGEGNFITISVESTQSATMPTCEDAIIVSYIAADIISSQLMTQQLKTISWICP